MKRSLLKRMILAQTLVLVLTWLASWVILLGHVHWAKGVIDSTLDLDASALALLLQDEQDPARMALQAQRIQQLDETSATQDMELKPGEYRSNYQIFDRAGRLLFRTAAAPERPLTESGPGFHNVEYQGRPWRVYVKEDPTHRLRVLVGQPRSVAQRIIWRAVRQSSLQNVIAFLVAALLTWVVARRALTPLHQLARTVAARNPRDLSPLSAEPDLVEARPLITAMNGLFHRVEELLESQNRFVADAAHELRTPLAVISAQAHMLERAPGPSERQLASRELQQGVERAAQLVSQLLSFARLDAADQAPAQAALDLATLAQDRVAIRVPQALARNQDLGYEGPSRLPWHGDASILTSAVDNLLGNAIRYTPPGGRITLRLAATPDGIRLEVEDTGPGIPPEFRESLFERFTRLPGTQETGSGLGLAIVHRAVALHEGRVTLNGRAGGPGLLAVIQLPNISI